MAEELEFSAQAFTKMVMHAMKYPHAVCSGLLLSPKSNVDGDEGDDETRITEAVPVSHVSHCLTPNIEIAYNSVNAYAQEQNLVISGYYQASRLNDNIIDTFSQRIADKISESYPKAVLCSLSFDKKLPVLGPHQLVDGKWRLKPPSTFKLENESQFIFDNVLHTKEKLYRNIVDFDEHFNNISLDWTNTRTSQKIDSLIASSC